MKKKKGKKEENFSIELIVPSSTNRRAVLYTCKAAFRVCKFLYGTSDLGSCVTA
jgi:hypothetical protein